MKDLFKGRLVRLAAVDPQELGRAYAEWSRDSEFKRLLDNDPPRLYSPKGFQEWLDKKLDPENKHFDIFCIRSLADDHLLGDLTLEVVNPGAREAFVGMAIGERTAWGRGFGTDAMQVLLRYAFTELNLRRVSLTVSEYNLRAMRSYEKSGFQPEGRLRGALNREGKRWDELYYGILDEEWSAKSEN